MPTRIENPKKVAVCS